MKISVITWDASFREKFHTVDTFGNQNYSKDKFEFLWCDFYEANATDLIKKINTYNNFKIVNLNNAKTTNWHLGKTINMGIKNSKGDILVIPDGDIIVESDFLNNIEKKFNEINNDNTVIYFRRWDEPENKSCEKSYQLDYLRNNTQLFNPTNYGGCFAIKRKTFENIGFYEEHKIFSGPGANGLEQYLRFRNKGLAILWDNKKIFHPYHSFTGFSDKRSSKLKEAEKQIPWLNSYNGLEQSWVIKSREILLDWKANDGSIDKYLRNIPSIDELILVKKNKISSFKKLFKKLIRKIK
ncbi:glycosyltransferase [uncultured Lutibacter sp.]|uniref:glycosyltransferase n=1 Tax=uncultured Lutibacter sp. TaxID=437739 RepID=UPI00262F1A71|nr:glycosyltransferase [uncultured Lutibacter sp.]